MRSSVTYGQGVAQRVVEEPLAGGEQQVADVERVRRLGVVHEPMGPGARQVELGVPGGDRFGRAPERGGHRRPPDRGKAGERGKSYPSDATPMQVCITVSSQWEWTRYGQMYAVSAAPPPAGTRGVNMSAADWFDDVRDMIVVGAGFSGLYMVHQARDELGLDVLGVEAGERSGRDVVLEPLPRRPVRLGELLLLLHLLPGAARRVGLVVALPRAARDPALPRVRRRPTRPASQLRVRHPGRRQDLGRGRRPLDRAHRHRSHAGRHLPRRRGRLPLGGERAGRPRLEDFGGEWFHTGRWPHEGVDFTGRGSPRSAPAPPASKPRR